MATEDEKKWFIYLTDHHEGPFSLGEMREKMAAGAVNSAHFVWSDGMSDWKAIAETPELESLLRPSPQPKMALPTAPRVISIHSQEAVRAPEVQLAETAQTTEAFPVTELTEPSFMPQEQPHAVQGEPSFSMTSMSGAPSMIHPRIPEALPRKPEKKGMSLGWPIFLILVGAMIFGTMKGYFDPVLKDPMVAATVSRASESIKGWLAPFSEKIPLLSEWLSPLPTLPDVKPEDYELLKKALKTDPKVSATVAVAVSQSDLLSPKFYIASNLPDGTQFDVYVIGIGDTLLGQTEFSLKMLASVHKGFGETISVRYPDGKPIPKGQYSIYVADADTQPPAALEALQKIEPLASGVPSRLPKGIRVFGSKSYFLGGADDPTYSEHLKEFHDKLQAKAQAELVEIRQFASTLDSQLSTTLGQFEKLGKSKPTAAGRLAWKTFSDGWNGLEKQLDATFVKWTPEVLASDYFYVNLYPQIQQSGQLIQKLHELQDFALTGKKSETASVSAGSKEQLEIELGQVSSQAQTALATLNAKVDQVSKLPPSPNGMPERDTP